MWCTGDLTPRTNVYKFGAVSGATAVHVNGYKPSTRFPWLKGLGLKGTTDIMVIGYDEKPFGTTGDSGAIVFNNNGEAMSLFSED